MPLDADVIVDRRKLRRKLTFWRIIAFAVLVAAIWVVGDAYFNLLQDDRDTDHIAKLHVTGFIYEDFAQLDIIDEIKENEQVKGVIVAINSPGGSTAGSEAIYNALRELNETKPIVSQIGTLGTSGGYMVAMASDHIIARRNTITGSIGVLFQYSNISELLDTVGISFDTVKSSKLKAEPSFYEPVEEEARTMLAALVNDMYEWFVGTVAERRSMDADAAKLLSDGRIYSGNQALEIGLIDEIGDQNTAIDWLAAEHNLSTDLPVVDWLPEYEEESLFFSGSLANFTAKVIQILLFGEANENSAIISRKNTFDGMLSIWQVPNIEPQHITGN